jgi:ribosomal 50S subunit-recycling heat shock protein
MRLDKYLKVTRIIKRRTVANEACDAAHVTVNGRPAKASYDVKIGDRIDVTFGARTLSIRVVEVKDTVGKDAASTLYEVIDS